MESRTEVQGIYRGSNGALINKDNTALSLYKSRKEIYIKLKSMESDVDFLKKELASIKELLIEMLQHKVQ